jgi:hypothetical protein
LSTPSWRIGRVPTHRYFLSSPLAALLAIRACLLV